MLECKRKGKITCDSIERVSADGLPEKATIEMTYELIAAQASRYTSITLHELAHHPEIQKKVQREIDTVLANYDNRLCYEAIKEMTYLESAFKEGMRTFPSLGFLVRQCAKRYTFEDLIITLQALHNDPKYFENPTEFRPERFTRPSPAAMISSCTCRLARVRARVSASGWE